MKTPVIWEKKDILTLICAYMRKHGFPAVTPEMLEYKGALEVKIMIEMPLTLAAIEDAAPAPAPAQAAPAATTGSSEPDEPDMRAILRASQNNAQSAQRFEGRERSLASNESYEFPKD